MSVLGVIGTMVWDTIWRDSSPGSPTEEWGGISYALAAADAVAPPDTRVRPIVKVGEDLAERAYHFLSGLSVIDRQEPILRVTDPNPRVELRYSGQTRRCETIRGGVPPWSWSELRPRIAGCDALYVNFITGDEMRLETARALRREFDGPIYVDIHSLLLSSQPGPRRLQPLRKGMEWLRCFDVVQVNEDELTTLAAPWGDPWAFAAQVVGREVEALFVTLGSRGAAYVIAPGAEPMRRVLRDGFERPGPARTGKLESQPVGEGDPTGCGDVWGMTCCCALRGGVDVEEAIRRANGMASRNVRHRGAAGLNRYLRGEIERE